MVTPEQVRESQEEMKEGFKEALKRAELIIDTELQTSFYFLEFDESISIYIDWMKIQQAAFPDLPDGKEKRAFTTQLLWAIKKLYAPCWVIKTYPNKCDDFSLVFQPRKLSEKSTEAMENASEGNGCFPLVLLLMFGAMVGALLVILFPWLVTQFNIFWH